MQTHFLKIHPQFLGRVLDGDKTFEVRKNDRDFQRGDRLYLQEWDPNKQELTGRAAHAHVTYVHAGLGMVDGYVVLGLASVTPES